MTDRTGQVVSDRYRIDRLLGEGGMGAVYLAEHTLMKKRFAVKVLHGDAAKNEEIVARFRREAEAAAHLDHPHIVVATDFGPLPDGAFFLVLEYIDGTSLREALANAPFSAARALRIARQIALALEAAHGAGIVHRDLKPENVMLVKKRDDDDFVKVLDFGVARFDASAEREGAAQPLTRVGTVMGTPDYMSPEQCLGERVDARADLYALGIMMYEMLAGIRPFEGDDLAALMSKHMLSPVPSFASRAPQVTIASSIELIVRKLLEKDPNDRYQTARVLIDAIDAVAQTESLDVAIGPPSSDRISIASSPDLPPATKREQVAPTIMAAAKPTAIAPPTPLDRVRRIAGRARSLAEAGVEKARPHVVAGLEWLEKKTKLPRKTILAAGAGLSALLFFVLLVVVIRSPSQGSTPGAKNAPLLSLASSRAAPTEKLRTAAAKGPAGLELLAEEYPHDPAVFRELAFAYDGQGRTTDALGAVSRLVDASDGQPVAPDVVRLVSRATAKADATDEAFRLLEEKLGTPGADALFDITVSKTAPPALRNKAGAIIAKPSVRLKASPAVGFAIDLDAAGSCEEKYDVLSKSGANADGRSLASLKALKAHSGCGRYKRYDCWKCMRGDDVLDRAIANAESH